MSAPRALLAVAVVLSETGLCFGDGSPGNNIINFFGGVYTSSNSVNNPSYVINSNSETKNGKCTQVIKVTGRGISDSFKVSCDKTMNMNTLSTETTMMVGDPKSFCVFSDEPSALVVIEDGKCTKRTYTTAKGQTTSSAAPLTDDECSAVLQKISDAEEKNREYWKEWNKNFTNTMSAAFPPGFPFAVSQKTTVNSEDETGISEDKSTSVEDILKNAFPPGFPFSK